MLGKADSLSNRKRRTSWKSTGRRMHHVIINDLFEHTLSFFFNQKRLDKESNSSKPYTYTRNYRKEVFFRWNISFIVGLWKKSQVKFAKIVVLLNIWSFHTWNAKGTARDRGGGSSLSYPWFTRSLLARFAVLTRKQTAMDTNVRQVNSIKHLLA